jgi:hypothetical protein
MHRAYWIYYTSNYSTWRMKITRQNGLSDCERKTELVR